MKEKLQVVDVKPLSDGIFEIQLERDDVTFTPGDCLALFGEDDVTSRPYSCASGSEDSVFRFVVREMPGGVVSSFLASRKPGDLVKVSPPFGWFRPGQPHKEAPYTFFATGTGISPFLSFFRSFTDRAPVQCFYGVRVAADAVETELIGERCELHLAVSREAVASAHRGRITDLLDQVTITKEMHYYLCGLDTMIDEVSIWLEKQGVEVPHIHRECFFNASYTS